MDKKLKLKDFTISEIEMVTQLSFSGGQTDQGLTEALHCTKDTHSPSGWSDDCDLEVDPSYDQLSN